jgi:type III restriction enzyme
MPDRVIENPIINSPYREPNRHSSWTRTGSTNEIAEVRRRSAYFAPVPRARKQAARQLELVTE